VLVGSATMCQQVLPLPRLLQHFYRAIAPGSSTFFLYAAHSTGCAALSSQRRTWQPPKRRRCPCLVMRQDPMRLRSSCFRPSVVGGEQRASGAASLPSGGRSPSHGVYLIRQGRTGPPTLTNRGTRQSERATRVMACTTRRPKYSWGSGRRAARQRRCLSPQRGPFAQPRRVLYKTSGKPNSGDASPDTGARQGSSEHIRVVGEGRPFPPPKTSCPRLQR
jgi:hypothetical protein